MKEKNKLTLAIFVLLLFFLSVLIFLLWVSARENRRQEKAFPCLTYIRGTVGKQQVSKSVPEQCRSAVAAAKLLQDGQEGLFAGTVLRDLPRESWWPAIFFCLWVLGVFGLLLRGKEKQGAFIFLLIFSLIPAVAVQHTYQYRRFPCRTYLYGGDKYQETGPYFRPIPPPPACVPFIQAEELLFQTGVPKPEQPPHR